MNEHDVDVEVCLELLLDVLCLLAVCVIGVVQDRHGRESDSVRIAGLGQKLLCILGIEEDSALCRLL